MKGICVTSTFMNRKVYIATESFIYSRFQRKLKVWKKKIKMKKVGMAKIDLGTLLGIFMLIGIIVSMATGNHFLTILLVPPLIALLILLVMCKLGLIPGILKKDQRYCIPAGRDTGELAKIFKRADSYVHAIGGELAHDIWSDKNVIDEIKKAVERGVKIKIACGPRFDVENFGLAKMANEGKISFFKLEDREKTHHFRINEKYDTLYHSGSDNRKDMVVWFNNVFSGKMFEERFNKTLEKAIKIDKGKFMDVFRADYPKIDETEELDKTDYLKIDEMGARHNISHKDDLAIKKLSKYLSG